MWRSKRRLVATPPPPVGDDDDDGGVVLTVFVGNCRDAVGNGVVTVGDGVVAVGKGVVAAGNGVVSVGTEVATVGKCIVAVGNGLVRVCGCVVAGNGVATVGNCVLSVGICAVAVPLWAEEEGEVEVQEGVRASGARGDFCGGKVRVLAVTVAPSPPPVSLLSSGRGGATAREKGQRLVYCRRCQYPHVGQTDQIDHDLDHLDPNRSL